MEITNWLIFLKYSGDSSLMTEKQILVYSEGILKIKGIASIPIIAVII